jgi:hypothetical protein
MDSLPTCEHDGCDREGDPCFLPDDPPDGPSYHFCGEHAHVEGFCRGCGGFFAGVGNFETSRTGLCDNCEGDLGEDDENDDEDWDFQDEWCEEHHG